MTLPSDSGGDIPDSLTDGLGDHDAQGDADCLACELEDAVADSYCVSECEVCDLREITDSECLALHVHLPHEMIVGELTSGRLHGRPVGNRWLVHRDAIRAWLLVPGTTQRDADKEARDATS